MKTVGKARGGGESELRKTGEKCRNRHAKLEAGERRPEAEMNPGPEGKMRARVPAAGQEPVGLGKDRRIPVGRRQLGWECDNH